MSTKMKTHPAADLFPMMTEDELQELAADIAANGLVHPIIIDDKKQVIDGRNRLAACEIAQVEPRFEQLNGWDPLAFILSANITRRHLTKGQQAMAVAMVYPEPEKGGRGKKGEIKTVTEKTTVSGSRITVARTVLRHSRELAENVMRGIISLDGALEKVEELKRQADSTENKHARLQAEAPDLAVRVAEENINLDEALAILQEREVEERRAREAGREAAKSIFEFAGHVASIHSAIDFGEDIRIPPKTLKTLENALDLLKNDMRKCHEEK
jgi:hypothetical protein